MTANFRVKKEEESLRLDVFLKGHYSRISREFIKAAILDGNVLVDGQVVKEPSLRVKSGQMIEFNFTPEEGLKPAEIPLEKIYENNDFLVINKPAGLVVHPGAGVKQGTLANALVKHYPELKSLGHVFRPGIVHRLDKDTSGLLLVAKNEKAYEYAKNLFQKRLVGKEYYVLVVGEMPRKHGKIDKPLQLAPQKRKVEISETGKPALTEYFTINVYTDPVRLDRYTLIRVKLHTGRTHQIRVHLASLGHPIAGDSLYGKGQPAPNGLFRQFLHAYKLTFKLPDGTVLDLGSPLPEDLQKVLDNLEKL